MPLSKVFPWLAAVVAATSLAGCANEEMQLISAEKEMLEKAKAPLVNIRDRTDKALKDGGHEAETLFYRVHLKQLSDNARAVTDAQVQEAAGKTAKVTSTVDKGERIFVVTLPRKDAAAAAKGLAENVPALWTLKAVLTTDTATFELVTWPGDADSLMRARTGATPTLSEIPLGRDLKMYQVSSDYSPKAANKALFDEVKALYAEVETKQNALLAKGHSQGVQMLSTTHAAFLQGVAAMPKFAAEFAAMETPPLFATATLEPGPRDIRIQATFADGVTIEEARKRAVAASRSFRGEAGEFSWDVNPTFPVVPMPAGFVVPEGFQFDPPAAK